MKAGQKCVVIDGPCLGEGRGKSLIGSQVIYRREADFGEILIAVAIGCCPNLALIHTEQFGNQLICENCLRPIDDDRGDWSEIEKATGWRPTGVSA